MQFTDSYSSKLASSVSLLQDVVSTVHVRYKIIVKFEFEFGYVDLYGIGCEHSTTTLVVHGSLGHTDFEWKSTNSCVTD